MKLLVLSDLHLEFSAFDVPDCTYDAVVLAGDISAPATEAIRWAKSAFEPGKPVVLVPGNHEYYRTCMPEQAQAMQAAAAGSDVHVLDGNVCVLGGVRFVGCTLWTDFALRIDTPWGPQSDTAMSIEAARKVMVDYRRIQVADRATPTGQRLLTAEDTLAMHRTQRAWLQGVLAEPFAGPTVVVTHHGPHRLSLVPQYADDWASGAFISELPDVFFSTPVLWVHGHTHSSLDYRVGNCRVVCNPRGYVNSRYPEPENPRFLAATVIDVS